MIDGIRICSFNTQGLGTKDPRKRRDVLNYLRSEKYSIICVQDSHFTKDIERFVTSEWGYKAFFSSNNSQSRGVAIFFTNTFEFTVHNEVKDNDGNFIILDVTIQNKRITLVNIYAPKKDEPDFFIKVMTEISNVNNDHIIVLGDFNLLLDPEKDGKNYKRVNNKKARDKVLELMITYNLYDAWREENFNSSKFTWSRKLGNAQFQMGRLDYILLSESLLNYSCKENILPGYRSDHSIASLTLSFCKSAKRKTFWKFNNSLLRNKEYFKEIKHVINEVKSKYTASPYNRENIRDVANKEYQPYIDPQLFYEGCCRFLVILSFLKFESPHLAHIFPVHYYKQ